MKYKVIGIMSGSSLDGLDIIYTHFIEQAGKWSYEIEATQCVHYNQEWQEKLKKSSTSSLEQYFTLDVQFGKYIANAIQQFIQTNQLQFQVDFIVLHGHTTLHLPQQGISKQLGCPATLASQLHLPVISDLRSMDVAYGGQGAPIIPIGEKLLFENMSFFLNIGGITNISYISEQNNIAFDIAPANAILNYFAQKNGFDFDNKGEIGRRGKMIELLMEQLKQIPYFNNIYPKSLNNQFGLNLIQNILDKAEYQSEDILHTYYSFLALTIKNSILQIAKKENIELLNHQLLISGGGALNTYLLEQIQLQLQKIGMTIFLPEEKIILYKEALVMGLIGVLRWREEINVFKSVTGAKQNSVNGAIWYASHLI